MDNLFEIGVQISDRMVGGGCFSWRMCLSSPLRMVITTNLYQGETVAEGKYPIMLFISSLGSLTVNILSNNVVLGKRQSFSTLPCRTMMYFTSKRYCMNFISICAESNQEINIAMYLRLLNSDPWKCNEIEWNGNILLSEDIKEWLITFSEFKTLIPFFIFCLEKAPDSEVLIHCGFK